MRLILAAMLAGLGLVRCVGTETGNPEADEHRLALVVWSTAPDVADVVPAGGASIERVALGLHSIDFIPCDPTAASEPALGEPAFAEPTAALDAPTVFHLAPGTYCSVVVTLGPVGDEPALTVEGELANGTPFALVGEGTSHFTLEGAMESADANGVPGAFLLALDVGLWFEGIDLASGTPQQDGVIRIDAATNAQLLTRVENQTAQAATVHADLDRDGALDADEQTPLTHRQ